MPRVRVFVAGAALAAVALLGQACGGYSEDDARERCDAEQSARGACFDGESLASCMKCFEDCGDDCTAANSCTERYSCPE